jgi:hypothetical protein
MDKMPLSWKEEPMTMSWCLDCHRHPERYLRDKSEVFVMDLARSASRQLAKGRELVKKNHVEVERLTNCSVCHR